jgi:hypothetical protein
MPLPGETGWARAEAAEEYLAGRRELTLDDELAAGWRELVADCLARRQEDRPTSADLRNRIGDLGRSRGRRTRRTSSGHRRLVAAASAVLVAVGVVGWLTLSPGHRPGSGTEAGAPAATALSTLSSSVSSTSSSTASSTSSSTASGTASSSVPSAPSVPSGTCVSRPQEQLDTFTGRAWHQVWYCLNDTGAIQYAAPDSKTVIGWIQTTTSWFLCYRRGARGPGGSDVWYYTQGDQIAAGWKNRRAWGYTPAGFLHLRTHPHPGVPQCPSGT